MRKFSFIVDLVNELESAAKLHCSGAVSEYEFAQAKWLLLRDFDASPYSQPMKPSQAQAADAMGPEHRAPS